MARRLHLRRTWSASAAPRRQHDRRRQAATAAALTALLVLGLSACSSGGPTSAEDSGGGSGAGEDVGSAADERAASALDADVESLTGAVRAAGRPARVAPLARQVIRTGEATLQADDVVGLRDEVGSLVQRYGGYVSSERSFNDEQGRLVEDRLVLRVPSSRFDQVMADFAEVATVLQPRTKTEDVTTEVIDVDSRVRTTEVSLDRLRSFLERSGDVNALIRLESEMAEREADLASLRAQQDYLEDQTSLATISLTLRRPPEEEALGEPADSGFLPGLRGGYDALKGVLVVAATLLGAVVPFALLAALVGVPVLLGIRATRRRRPATPPPATTG